MSSVSAVWHYTVGVHLPAIEQASSLVPVQAPYACSGQPILWFSRQAYWEPSAASFCWKRSGATHIPPATSTAERQGLYRFGLRSDDVRLAPWPAVTRLADIGIPETMAMAARGLQQGAVPTDWCGALEAIPLTELLFQRWDGWQWRDADLAACATQAQEALPTPALRPHNLPASHDIRVSSAATRDLH